MRNTIRVGLLLSALLLAACGAGDVAADGETTSTTSPAAAATTEAAPATTTTVPPATTTTTPETTTTTTAATTTTSAAQKPGDADFASVMGSLDSSEVTSARIEGFMEVTGLDKATVGLSEATILFSTAFDATTGDNSFAIDMSSMMEAVEMDESDPFADMAMGMLGQMEFRQIGDRVFMKYPFFTAMFGVETDWLSMPAEDGAQFATSMDTVESDPYELLEIYEEGAADMEDLGVEPVNGVEATHYRISLDTETLELTPEEEASLEASGMYATGVIPMDLWISEEGHIVRLLLELDGTGIDAPASEQFEQMTMRYDVFDINQPVSIEEPPASDVTTIEDLEEMGLDFGY